MVYNKYTTLQQIGAMIVPQHPDSSEDGRRWPWLWSEGQMVVGIS